MRIKVLVATLVLAISGVCGALLMPGEAFADNKKMVTCPDGSLNKTANSLAGCNIPEEKEGDPTVTGTAVDIINVVVGVVGIVTVGVIVLGGISYATSQGDAAKITKAKNTILYGVVGLIICMLAFAIVNFVVKGVFGNQASSSSDETSESDEEKLKEAQKAIQKNRASGKLGS